MSKRIHCSVLMATLFAGCVGDDSVKPIDPPPRELPRIDETLLLDRFVAGAPVQRPLVFVDNTIFVKFELGDRSVWAQLLPKENETDLASKLYSAHTVELTIGDVTLPPESTSNLKRNVASNTADITNVLQTKEGLVFGAVGRVKIDPSVVLSQPEYEIGVAMLENLYALAPECKEHDWWEKCSAASLDAACSFTAQIPCHTWTWVQEQINVTCADGRQVPGYKYTLSQSATTYLTPLKVSGKCTSMDFTYLDWTTPDDGCYCLVTDEVKCPAAPAAPATPDFCNNKQCKPVAKADGTTELICDELALTTLAVETAL